MIPASTVFLGLVFAGVFALIGGMFLTRLHWRQDIPPYGLRTPFLDVTRHPEKYAKDAPFGLIRSLSVVGAALLVGAVGVVTWEILRTMQR